MCRDENLGLGCQTNWRKKQQQQQQQNSMGVIHTDQKYKGHYLLVIGEVVNTPIAS